VERVAAVFVAICAFFTVCLGDRQLEDSEDMFAVCDICFWPKKRVTSLRAPLKMNPNVTGSQCEDLRPGVICSCNIFRD